jgi:beta-aspartyl-dipeptidase (metallo-type)
MIKVVRNGTLFAPKRLKDNDLLIIGSKIGWVGQDLHPPAAAPVPVQIIDAGGMYIFPGFIDAHVHIAGGGGEGGFRTRTPEITLSSLVRGGITTVIGCLGTDGITRSVESLYAKARGLTEEGISAYILSGSYRVPTTTVTGDPMKDLMFLDLVVGTGEIAIADHRSSQPTLEEVRHLAAAVRVGGILSGKAGVVNVHLGDGEGGLAMLEEIVATTELPYSQFLPTHVNRNERVFAEAVAYALKGGYIDLTAGAVDATNLLAAHHALKRCLEQGVPPERITLTSDGQGSLPEFDDKGEFIRLGVGQVGSLMETVRDAVLGEGIELETALRTVTCNPAERYKLTGKGRLLAGCDADLIFVNPKDFRVATVIAKGEVLMLDHQVKAKGTFE